MELLKETLYRLCNKCHQEKELNDNNFHKDKGKKNGYKYHCKECVLNHHREKNYKRKRDSIPDKIRTYKQSDKIKGRSGNLSEEFVKNCMNSVCIYCGFPATGLDRLDNTKGHTEENCVPCCKECNIARMDNFSHEEMRIIGKSIRKVKLERIHKN